MLPINGTSSELFCPDLMMLIFAAADTTQSLWFRRRLMRISRNREVTGDGRVFAGLTITYVSYPKQRTDIMFNLDLVLLGCTLGNISGFLICYSKRRSNMKPKLKREQLFML